MTPDNLRDPYRQMDDGWSRAMELALTPLAAGGVGYLFDRLIGTVPLITIIMVVLAVAATFVKMYYTYDAQMKAHDADSPWGRARAHADRAAGQP
jgi:F0F1-type ATP synthase assembly protein I